MLDFHLCVFCKRETFGVKCKQNSYDNLQRSTFFYFDILLLLMLFVVSDIFGSLWILVFTSFKEVENV